MKAFQLKIVIKNSKPPIWRRLIVPAGITFSQLSMILNEAMGWAGYHLFEFEFYHRNLRIVEEPEDFGFGGFDELDAQTTFIRKFLEEEDWFTYTYDFGDDWQHRVTVEKVLEDYEYNYPQVVKFKGDCPPEDCGGIWGYYDCLDIIQDPSHPEYAERLEWMEMRGYSDAYDMARVNEVLAGQYFYRWGEGETRSQQELYEELLEGKYGLCATKQNKNEPLDGSGSEWNGRRQSGKAGIDDEASMMAELLRMEVELERLRAELHELRRPSTLHDVFRDFKKQDLAEIAKEKRLKGVSGCNKHTLIERLVEFMLRPEEMTRYFSCLGDEAIAEWEQLIEGSREFELFENESMEDLCGASYIGLQSDGTCRITEDVIAGYQAIKGEAFDETRKRNSFLLACLRAAGLLYGITPVDVFLKLLKTGLDEEIDELAVYAAMEELPAEFCQYIVKNRKIYHEALYSDDHGLLDMQGEGEYYMPSLQEIWQLGTVGQISDTPEMHALERCLVQKGKVSEQEAKTLCNAIQCEIRNGGNVDDIIELLAEFGVEPTKWKQAQAITDCVMRVIDTTRMAEYRGFTVKEMREKAMRRSMVGPVTVGFERAGKVTSKKIYPNDPCPCGSGKKFKKCCMNK